MSSQDLPTETFDTEKESRPVKDIVKIERLEAGSGWTTIQAEVGLVHIVDLNLPKLSETVKPKRPIEALENIKTEAGKK